MKFAPQVKQNAKPKSTGMVTAFRWELPSVMQKSVVCSPSFDKWDRKWRIPSDTDGKTYLHYCLGVDPVHLTVRYVKQTISSRQQHGYISLRLHAG